jgi:hypothetical protein
METDARKLRAAIIEYIRQNRNATLSYSKLLEISGTGLLLPDDRAKLDSLLTEIFEYEHMNNRPLLTIMVTKKDSNEHGDKFYILLKKFGYEKNIKSDLVIQFQKRNEVIEFWESDENYNAYK